MSIKCANCDYENVSLARECTRCGNSLHQAPPEVEEIDVHPPRATKWQKRLRKIKYFFQAEEQVEKGRQWMEQNPFVRGILAALVPGIHHLRGGKPRLGWIFLGGYFLLLGLLIFTWGMGLSRFLFGGLIFFHVFCGMDAYPLSEWREFTLGQRIGFSLVASALVLTIYLSFQVGIRNYLIEDVIIESPLSSPVLQKGDMVLVNRYSTDPRQFEVGDVVFYETSEGKWRGGRMEIYQIGEIKCIDRILAGPGDELEVKEGRIFRNGRQVPSTQTPLNPDRLPTQGKTTVPKGHYFIYPSLLAPGRVPKGLLDKIRWEVSLVPFDKIQGRIFMIYAPLKRRGFL